MDNGNDSVKLKSSGSKLGPYVTIFVFVFGQFVVSLIWAIRQESRITQAELALVRLDFTTNNISGALHALESRIDRLDTPLSRRVDESIKRIDGMESRIQIQSERLQRVETIVEQLRQR